MSHATAQYPSQQSVTETNNHDDGHPRPHRSGSAVRETVKKFDKLAKSNGSSSVPPPRPPPLKYSSAPIKINNKSTQPKTETPTSSLSSLNDSTHDEHGINPKPTEQKGPQSNDKMTTNLTTKTTVLTKPQISTARIDIRPPAQKKPTPRRRRTPPPIPIEARDHLKSKQSAADNIIYVNSDTEFDDNHHNDAYEVHDDNEIAEPESFKAYAKPAVAYKEVQAPSAIQTNGNTRSHILNNHRRRDEKPPQVHYKPADVDSIGLEINEPISPVRRHISIDNGYDNRHKVQRAPTMIEDYGVHDIEEENEDISPSFTNRPPASPPPPPPPPPFALRLLKGQQQQQMPQEEFQSYTPKRSLPLSNFVMQLGALLVVFLICMVLVLGIREEEAQLRTAMHLIYTYIYVASIAWMIWCTLDIIKFRRQWMDITSSAQDHEEYMDISERHPHIMFYFPDMHNTGGLFMRIGAGLLCMGSLILTVIELARTVAAMGSNELTRDSNLMKNTSAVTITRSISYIFRFLFHCVQFTFLFRYGNLVIDRYHLFAKMGLIHLVVANFCTWFEAIVFETLEQIHKNEEEQSSTTNAPNATYSTTMTTSEMPTSTDFINETVTVFIKAVSTSNSEGETGNNRTTLDILNQIELATGAYLYPCLIEYSLISLTVFFIMWRNVGRKEKRSFLRFGDRHVFTVNCARASRGLLVGGIIFLLTILTLIPTYLLDDDAISVTHITELVLLSVSLLTVCMSYIHTTKLYYDAEAHVDVFDQCLIIITTVGDFAYSFFGLFAAMLIDQSDYKNRLPVGVDIAVGFIALFQTFLQSGFILDTLKRRTTTKQENRSKPGRETVTALLLMNLAIWMHDSLSAKKMTLNPLQVAYYDGNTWAIIQAFTSPLSIFYRFHSSVCLADIWQEVYKDIGDNDGTRPGGKQPMRRLGGHDSQH